MRDCSFNVDRGADQSILIEVYTDETLSVRKNISSCTLTAYIARIADPILVLTKNLRTVDAVLGSCALDLVPAESRSIMLGPKMSVEIELREAGRQIIVGRGRVTGIGGINLDM